MASSSPEIHYFDDQQHSRPIDIPGSSPSYRDTPSWEQLDFGSQSFPYTPSYVGSFDGSGHDEGSILSQWAQREDVAVMGPPVASGGLFDSVTDDNYDPNDYDHDQSSPFHILDDQPSFASLGPDLFPSDTNNNSGFMFHDQFSPRKELYPAAPSPASSLGGQEQAQGLRSRASSISSYQGQPSPSFNRLEFGSAINEQFDKLDIQSWQQQQQQPGTPSHHDISATSPPLVEFSHTAPSPPALPGSPAAKPQSPPQLLIPADAPSMSAQDTLTARPRMNPSFLGAQPAINIMPATPVSGGAAAETVSFQSVLRNLSGNRHRRDSDGRQFARTGIPEGFHRNGGTAPGSSSTESTVLPSISSFAPPLGDFKGLMNQDVERTQGQMDPASTQEAVSWSLFSASGQSQGTASTLPVRSYHHGYNLPAIPSFLPHNQSQQLPHQDSMNANNAHPPFDHTQSAPSTIPTTSTLLGSQQSFPQASQTAVNHMHFGPNFLLAPSQTRSRSKSDTSTRPPVWAITPPASSPAGTSDVGPDEGLSSSLQQPNQNARGSFNVQPHYLTSPSPELDFNLISGDLASSLRRANSDGQRHKRSAKSEDLSSLRTPRLIPTSNADFIRPVKMDDGSLAPIDPRTQMAAVTGSSSSNGGPSRRRGSSSGHERNASLSSLRSAPYSKPSPHASPVPSPHHSPLVSNKNLPSIDLKVERPLVTTPATKNASAIRRRAEATFVCQVPGCGSTFTRHFNLRGHMRSHNEERPFKCKWPGCEKGFARQHDCKRHEALHLNIRPYTCEGCHKTFARMDALNRHLRSEGGIECQRQTQTGELSGTPGSSSDGHYQSVENAESTAWQQGGGGILM